MTTGDDSYFNSPASGLRRSRTHCNDASKTAPVCGAVSFIVIIRWRQLTAGSEQLVFDFEHEFLPLAGFALLIPLLLPSQPMNQRRQFSDLTLQILQPLLLFFQTKCQREDAAEQISNSRYAERSLELKLTNGQNNL